ncbi:hypothetical protein O7598_16010 [Micromonospora sp. WMMC241]|uniref:hypothetical protein n=1 Tax=Micromonospora sp. WMMC241 TaxID=3015159 RepID=UPI0022B6CF18|nr:hypothetical protein [Micromonospora sp. WMMC241]MCZ7437914.1 hypothetical protein [Micromonospora sp. WMMC241]
MPTTDIRTPLLRTVLAWLVGNLLIGVCAILPIGAIHTLSHYLRAAAGDDVVSPYGPAGARFAVAEISIMSAVLLVAATFVNRRLRRARHVGLVPLLAATLVPLALPFLVFWFGTDHSL